MKNQKWLNIITITTAILFLLWFVSEPSYEPVIGFIISIGTLISVTVFNRRKNLKRLIYVIHSRGFSKVEMSHFLDQITYRFIQVSSYKVEKSSGEFFNVILESETKINLKELYRYSVKMALGRGKIYYVKGRNKCYRILGDGISPKYFDARVSE